MIPESAVGSKIGEWIFSYYLITDFPKNGLILHALIYTTHNRNLTKSPEIAVISRVYVGEIDREVRSTDQTEENREEESFFRLQ